VVAVSVPVGAPAVVTQGVGAVPAAAVSPALAVVAGTLAPDAQGFAGSGFAWKHGSAVDVAPITLIAVSVAPVVTVVPATAVAVSPVNVPQGVTVV
jgi:hypothetical protein